MELDLDYLTPKKTARYPLDEVFVPRDSEQAVVLIMKHAGRSNAAFTNATVKTPASTQGASAVDTRNAADERMARIFAKTVIVDWENVVERGKPVPFTPEQCEELLLGLIHAKRPDIVLGVTMFAMDADNFRDPVVSADALGKG